MPTRRPAAAEREPCSSTAVLPPWLSRWVILVANVPTSRLSPEKSRVAALPGPSMVSALPLGPLMIAVASVPG